MTLLFCAVTADGDGAPVGSPEVAVPEVAIIFPSAPVFKFHSQSYIRVMASAKAPDGINRVEFYARTDLIGVATNAPYAADWRLPKGANADLPEGRWELTAVAVSNSGVSTTSAPVVATSFGIDDVHPNVTAYVLMRSPTNGQVLAEGATVTVSVEALATQRPLDTASMELRVKGSVVATADGAPYTFTTPGLVAGNYGIAPRLVLDATLTSLYQPCDDLNALSGLERICPARAPVVHVVKLAFASPTLTAEGRFESDVVTAFPGQETTIESSNDLINWTLIRTEVPGENSFRFVDPSPSSDLSRYFRIQVSP